MSEVNDKPVLSMQCLSDGDMLTIGARQFQIVFSKCLRVCPPPPLFALFCSTLAMFQFTYVSVFGWLPCALVQTSASKARTRCVGSTVTDRPLLPG